MYIYICNIDIYIYIYITYIYYIYKDLDRCVYIYVYIRMYRSSTCIHMNTCIYEIYTHIHIYICIYTYIHIQTKSEHMYIGVCVYTYVYMYGVTPGWARAHICGRSSRISSPGPPWGFLGAVCCETYHTQLRCWEALKQHNTMNIIIPASTQNKVWMIPRV